MPIQNGTWWARTKEQAAWYVVDCPSRVIVSCEIDDETLVKYLAANLAWDVRRFSADPENEWYIPSNLTLDWVVV